MTFHASNTLPADFDMRGLVYVRPIALDELQRILPPNALDQLDTTDDLFAVYNSDGERLAIVEGREAAFAAARAHQLTPTSLH
ncbi:MAG: DUF1150 domain-containing protein [Hyphomonadaceae bacterium]|nr:DUF1150 domain-containing protein [Hyphomonadaceae bacterium]